MAEPDFLGDGNTPRRSDTMWFIEQKILGAIRGGGGGGGSGAGLSGAASPEGSVSAAVGSTYVQTSTTPASFWVKKTGSGNTGWDLLIEGI